MRLDENRRQRLELLADNLSIDCNGDEVYSALFSAVDRALGDVFLHLQKTAEDICITDSKGGGAALMLEILQRKTDDLDAEASEHLLTQLLSRQFGSYSTGMFADALNARAVQCSVAVSEKTVAIEQEAIANLASLMEFCRIINDFAPPFFRCVSSGNGVPFSKWDSLSASWYQLDKMNVPFYLIETFNIQE